MCKKMACSSYILLIHVSKLFFDTYLFVGANTGRTTEVELSSFNCERLTGA